MSDPTPAPAASQDALPLADAPPPSHHRHARPRRRTNALAVAALILAVVLSPFAALFGHIAAGQIARSQGAERGAALAWVAVGFGYLWLAGYLVAAAVLYQAFTAPLPP